MNIEERLERLENFIGNIDQIMLYANNLQQVLDRYIQPLYIEQGSGRTMMVTDYLGDLENIPRNIIFKIRASHNTDNNNGTDAKIIFSRGSTSKEFVLRKIENNATVLLTENDYIAGEVYDVYLNSQDVAIITASDVGVRALSEVAALDASLTSRINSLETELMRSTASLGVDISDAENRCMTYIDNKYEICDSNINELRYLTSGMSRDVDRNFIFSTKVTARVIETPYLVSTDTVDFTRAKGFQLPSGSTISDPSDALQLANRQWVRTEIESGISNYHSNFHYYGTAEPSSAMNGKDVGSYYYKI
jgi:hypothetical protein